MNSPEDLADKLARQWHNPGWREQRLLSPDAWPVELPIGRPGAAQFENNPARVRQHIEHWRQVKVGQVEWGEQKYRNADEAVSLPLRWRLHRPSEWVQACADVQVADGYALLSRLIAQIDPLFHVLLIRRLPRIGQAPEAEIVQAAQMAMELEPGAAQGKPLRALSIAGGDSKFFERNRWLLTAMLDLRFAGEVSELGLETFLGAVSGSDHWLLLAPLQADILPFEQLRIRAGELARTPLPAGHILVIENERCLHQLPQIPDCIAVLGAGLNVNWLQAEWLAGCRLAYWGDIDTWGLAILSKVRTFQPHVQALMMERPIFDRFEGAAVAEPAPYQADGLQGLTEQELQLFRYLLGRGNGRLEQEFLPAELVGRVIGEWINSCDN